MMTRDELISVSRITGIPYYILSTQPTSIVEANAQRIYDTRLAQYEAGGFYQPTLDKARIATQLAGLAAILGIQAPYPVNVNDLPQYQRPLTTSLLNAVGQESAISAPATTPGAAAGVGLALAAATGLFLFGGRQ